MSLLLDTRHVVIASCMILTACSETKTNDITSAPDIRLQDPNTYMTVGSPGSTVDCKQIIPCRWVSADTQFSLTVTNSDNTATRSRLSINYSISTVHDTDVFVSRSDDVLDANGLSLRATDQSLGGGNGSTPQGVVAGTAIQGALYFDNGTSSNSITQWSVGILDGGILRTPAFINLPVGALSTAQADCQNTLPCVWSTPQNNVAITLQSVGGISVNGRLSAEFSVETATNTSVVLDTGSTAIGADGIVIEGSNVTLQSETDYEKLTTEATTGKPVNGSVRFYRTVSVPDSLQLLTLIVYEDQPVPRWNPQFINVPIL